MAKSIKRKMSENILSYFVAGGTVAGGRGVERHVFCYWALEQPCQPSVYTEILGELFKCRLTLRDLGQGLRFFVSNQLPGAQGYLPWSADGTE